MKLLLVVVAVVLMCVAGPVSASASSSQSQWWESLKKRARAFVSTKFHAEGQLVLTSGSSATDHTVSIHPKHYFYRCVGKPGKLTFDGTADDKVRFNSGSKTQLDAWKKDHGAEGHATEHGRSHKISHTIKDGQNFCVWAVCESRFTDAELEYSLHLVAPQVSEPSSDEPSTPEHEHEEEEEEEDEEEEEAPAQGTKSWKLISKCYPQGEGEEVRKMIGGHLDDPTLINTCAIRMSHTLNCAGFKLPRRITNSYVLVGGPPKKWNYLIRVKELYKNFILSKFGQPTISKGPVSGSNRGVDPAAFKGKKGIIRFDTSGAWSDASGHFDLWDGTQMWETNHRGATNTKKYFDLSVRVQLWEFN